MKRTDLFFSQKLLPHLFNLSLGHQSSFDHLGEVQALLGQVAADCQNLGFPPMVNMNLRRGVQGRFIQI